MSTLTLSDITLEDLLPHRGAMLLVGEVLAVDSRNATALFVVDLAWPMADEHGVHPLILVEMAAQTAGICNGWGRIQTKGKDSEQMGWLVGIKKAEFLIGSLPFGGVITAVSENTYSFESLREVSCELSMNNQIIGRATLQLFQAPQK